MPHPIDFTDAGNARTMIRLVLSAGLASASLVLAGLGPAQAGGELRHRPLPPPEIAYRDPAYLPPPPPLPVVRVPRSLNLPLYNEPPRRF
ncbi:hypothetical protein ASF27_10295 [Methylobacterium sp. Leaf102]|nr:hypothetical protein ASF22_12470 [Methylobacterium sp. Leaf87]KQP24490.1 hypothetical protein ASF27_10295 [Methylobacterium sp. Leaf102]KQP60289.1 hypothetical protein ASF52_08065 [Methylobacterium sp. Leaf112]